MKYVLFSAYYALKAALISKRHRIAKNSYI